MARPLRVQYENAMYHVINRGNYRADVFGTVGAAKAFEAALFETCERHEWGLFAYAIMRNHFHLAVVTPQANLVEGMHWLQGTYATRFNGLRRERGHLFQGRYHALLIENAAALSHVVDYIHLNPVRARTVPADQIAGFRWSSLRRFVSGSAPECFRARDWLAHLGLQPDRAGWNEYITHLRALEADPAEQEALGFATMSRGWAIGTAGWRKAVVEDHAHRALELGLAADAIRDLKHARWRLALSDALKRRGKGPSHIADDANSAGWKVEAARELRAIGASCGWIAQNLNMGPVASMRVYLARAS